jgi:hypothetical protein
MYYYLKAVRQFGVTVLAACIVVFASSAMPNSGGPIVGAEGCTGSSGHC